MKNILFIFILLGFNYSFSQNEKCIEFKTGKFIYESKDYGNWQVVRTDSTQIETEIDFNIIIVSEVNWKSDCNYTLTYTKINNPDKSFLIGKIIDVKILETSGNKVKVDSYFEDANLKLTMIKVEDF